MCCGFSVLLLVLVALGLVLSPVNAPIAVCDIRWDLAELKDAAHQGKKNVEIAVDVSVSLWNPNRFSIEMGGVSGLLYVHETEVARLNWSPVRGSLLHVEPGNVRDFRLVVEVRWEAIVAIPALVVDLMSVEGIVLELTMKKFFRLNIFGVETAPIRLGPERDLLYLNQVDRGLCRCQVPRGLFGDANDTGILTV
jgi:hypothetical protein